MIRIKPLSDECREVSKKCVYLLSLIHIFVESTITIGCGEFAEVDTLAKICKTYKEKYPLVQIVLHTATADAVSYTHLDVYKRQEYL